ncbi:glycosyltransferase family 4 protein [Cytobacillus sp. IB215665]|uniref:glycosyltransferase family 4 protein n=1 Tax=Cytobacillus sp. IB215665 TaxID=3097357 RepID=UPI002A0BCA00|nr:glycosyltransferase family 4 protein [Cytobacillus sp. IB215665]MDX8364344.1 glycosyltransferase family 4 protein [Cytobacillus sp. IB215665]
MMRVLEITPFLISGSGKVVTTLSLELRKYCEVTVATSNPVEQIKNWDEYEGILKKNDVPIIKVDSFKRDYKSMWMEIISLTTILDQFDLVHVHAGYPAFLVNMAKELCGKDIPIVATFHSWNVNRPAWMNIADGYAFNMCDEIYTMSYYWKEFLEVNMNIDKNKLEVIPWGIDVEYCENIQINKKLKILYCESDEFCFVTLGRVEERKGILHLVKSFKKALNQIKRAKLIIIGEIAEQDYYEKVLYEIHQSGIQEHVVFTGMLKKPLELVKCCNVFVFPTLSEGLGIVGLEAMALQVPVIASYTEGIQDYLRPNINGIGVKPGNIDELADALIYSYENYYKLSELTKSAKMTVKKKYDINECVSKYVNTIRRHNQ